VYVESTWCTHAHLIAASNRLTRETPRLIRERAFKNALHPRFDGLFSRRWRCQWELSKVSSIVTVYGKFRGKLTFEKFYSPAINTAHENSQKLALWSLRLTHSLHLKHSGARWILETFSKIGSTVITSDTFKSELTFWEILKSKLYSRYIWHIQERADFWEHHRFACRWCCRCRSSKSCSLSCRNWSLSNKIIRFSQNHPFQSKSSISVKTVHFNSTIVLSTSES